MFILVPALLGLKGNLEMTLASRLSTAVRNMHVCLCAPVCFIYSMSRNFLVPPPLLKQVNALSNFSPEDFFQFTAAVSPQ